MTCLKLLTSLNSHVRSLGRRHLFSASALTRGSFSQRHLMLHSICCISLTSLLHLLKFIFHFTWKFHSCIAVLPFQIRVGLISHGVGIQITTEWERTFPYPPTSEMKKVHTHHKLKMTSPQMKSLNMQHVTARHVCRHVKQAYMIIYCNSVFICINVNFRCLIWPLRYWYVTRHNI